MTNPVDKLPEFEKELEKLINRLSLESLCDTPDYILAAYLKSCLVDYAVAVRARDKHEGRQKQEELLKPI